jgi:hypothetical protein
LRSQRKLFEPRFRFAPPLPTTIAFVVISIKGTNGFHNFPPRLINERLFSKLTKVRMD